MPGIPPLPRCFYAVKVGSNILCPAPVLLLAVGVALTPGCHRIFERCRDSSLCFRMTPYETSTLKRAHRHFLSQTETLRKQILCLCLRDLPALGAIDNNRLWAELKDHLAASSARRADRSVAIDDRDGQ